MTPLSDITSRSGLPIPQAPDIASAEPLYTQLDRAFRALITEGKWPAGAMIPSENELSQALGVARMTVRSVITGLVQEGILVRSAGRGTFVREQKITAHSPAYLGLRSQLEESGYRVQTDILDLRRQPADDIVAGMLDIPAGSDVFYLLRLRSANDMPLSVHESWLPASLVPTLSRENLAGDRQLCHVCEEDFGLVNARVEETLESVPADREAAALLELAEGAPLLLLEDRILSPSGQPFEYTRVRFRGDQVKLKFSINAETAAR